MAARWSRSWATAFWRSFASGPSDGARAKLAMPRSPRLATASPRSTSATARARWQEACSGRRRAALRHGLLRQYRVGDRLDFTVIGPDVNLTSRIERFCRELDTLADHVGGICHAAGPADVGDRAFRVARLRQAAPPVRAAARRGVTCRRRTAGLRPAAGETPAVRQRRSRKNRRSRSAAARSAMPP